MREGEARLNREARFVPMAGDSGPTGEYSTRPCLVVGGARVYAWFEDGELVVDADTADADRDAVAVVNEFWPAGYRPDGLGVTLRVNGRFAGFEEGRVEDRG